MTVVLLVLAAVAAVTDWTAVGLDRHRVELVAKPATLALLLAGAATADLGRGAVLVLAALAFSLLGDVALLFDDEARPATAFRLGLAAFVGAHVCYLGAFAHRGLNPLDVVAGLLIVLGGAGLTVRPVLTALRSQNAMLVLVGGYSLLLGAMVVLAVGTGLPLVALGGVAFLVSDSVLARTRFAGPVRHGPLLVAVTYHLAQFLLVIGLIRRF